MVNSILQIIQAWEYDIYFGVSIMDLARLSFVLLAITWIVGYFYESSQRSN